MFERGLKSFFRYPFRWALGSIAVIVGLIIISNVLFKSSDKPTQNNSPLITKNSSSQPDSSYNPSQAQLPDSSETPSANQNKGKGFPTPTGKDVIFEDGDEGDDAVIEGEETAKSRSALPWLPIRTKMVQADYKKILASGDLVVVVKYRGSKTQAENVWNAFLKKHNDPGTAYLVVYEVE